MRIFINAEENKEIFQVLDYTTFSVDSKIDKNETTIQVLVFVRNNDPIVLMEYKFDRGEYNEEDYLDDMSEIVRCIEILVTDIKRAIANVKSHHSITSKNTYIINIYDYITKEGFFCVEYKIVTKKLRYLEDKCDVENTNNIRYVINNTHEADIPSIPISKSLAEKLTPHIPEDIDENDKRNKM